MDYPEATPGNKDLEKDDNYKWYFENYYLLKDKEKKWFDKHKKYDFEKWAKYIARNGTPRDYPGVDEKMEELKQSIKFLTQNEYSLALRYYGGYRTKIYIKHNSDKCNYNKFWVNSTAFFYQNSRCPVCKESKGETKIRNFLNYYKIPFKSQYSFDDLRGEKNRKLRFDFGILDKNKKLVCLVEFDGIYHYEVSKRSTENNLVGQQYRDIIKNKYCENNNIKLLRIPYWEYKNIYEILQKELL